MRRTRREKGAKVFTTSFTYAAEDEPWLEKLYKLADRERVAMSIIIVKAIKEYIERHWPGNPQKPLIIEEKDETQDPAIKFKQCAYSRYYERPKDAYPIPICWALDGQFVGINYEECAKCDKWAHKSEVKRS